MLVGKVGVATMFQWIFHEHLILAMLFNIGVMPCSEVRFFQSYMYSNSLAREMSVLQIITLCI